MSASSDKDREYARLWRAKRTPKQKEDESKRKAVWYASLSPEQKKEIGSRKHRYSDKAKAKKRTRSKENHLRKKYGLTLLEKQWMLEDQNNRCANTGCGKELLSDRDKHVDHSHTTGKVRSVLCNNCNVALGLLKDDTDRIEGLLRYLEKHA